jgi:small-conductance mechanosensitive channel
MSDLLDLVREHGAWALGVALGFPIALVITTELGFALSRRGHPVTPWVRRIRVWVLPAIAGVLFLRGALGLSGDDIWVRIASTATWFGLVIVALGAANAIIFEGAASGSWQQRIPRLLRDLVRVVLVAVAAALAYSFIWGREIEGALAALGVTSIVAGLALQEPLGNLFSGLMLLMERPFEVGDSIEVGGVSGTVTEINWRSAHIEALGGMVQVVPNSMLNKDTISNYSRPLPIRMELLELGFSFDDPPNKVCNALLEVARTTPGVVQSPKPIAATIGYGDHSVNYRLIWRVSEAERWTVRNDLVTRIWYMARREALTMPYPVSVNIQHLTDAPFHKPTAAPAEVLTRIPHIPRVPAVEHTGTRVLSFGKGEVIFDEGHLLDGVYLVVSGAVSLQLVRPPQTADIATVTTGGFFGEAGMYGTQADARAIAVEDTDVLLFGPETVRLLFEASPTLARDTGHAIDVRRKALQSARTALRGAGTEPNRTVAPGAGHCT